MRIEPIKKLEQGEYSTEQFHERINAIIDRINFLVLNLKPSAQPEQENKGYENEPFDNKIGDPNDR